MGWIDLDNLQAKHGVDGVADKDAAMVDQLSGGVDGVTAVTATLPIVSSGGAAPDISHAASGVNPGTYSLATVTVDAKGHVTSAATGSAAGTVTATPPIASSGGANPNITHLTSGAAAGTYQHATVTVNATGHVTSISDGTERTPFIAGQFDSQYGGSIAVTPFEAWCPVGTQYPVPAGIKFEYVVPYACTGVRLTSFFYNLTFPGINFATMWVTFTTAGGVASRIAGTNSLASGFTGPQDTGDIAVLRAAGDRIGVEMDLSTIAAGTSTIRCSWSLWLLR